jgi:hypothetical protein
MRPPKKSGPVIAVTEPMNAAPSEGSVVQEQRASQMLPAQAVPIGIATLGILWACFHLRDPLAVLKLSTAAGLLSARPGAGQRKGGQDHRIRNAWLSSIASTRQTRVLPLFGNYCNNWQKLLTALPSSINATQIKYRERNPVKARVSLPPVFL